LCPPSIVGTWGILRGTLDELSEEEMNILAIGDNGLIFFFFFSDSPNFFPHDLRHCLGEELDWGSLPDRAKVLAVGCA